MIIGLATALVLAAAGTAYAGVTVAGSSESLPLESTTTSTAVSNTKPTTRPAETPLEGDVLTKAVAAATAKMGAGTTVVRAETDADGHAAYEVHMVLADGTTVTVYVDEAFNVVSVEQKPAKPAKDTDEDETGHNPGTPWGEKRTAETPLEGDVLSQVLAAATAKVGVDAKVLRAEADADGNAVYEVHMLLADGTLVTVYVDASYVVVSVTEKKAGGRSAEVREDCENQQVGQKNGEKAKDGERTRTGKQTQTTTQDVQRPGGQNGSDGRTGGHNGGGSHVESGR
jgi:uncharacterized membrane protein YkoI